ncbi:diguanylate cyclase [Aggregicoccus sp. 17bor-14]|uniref:diguanylate cyclase n=1 Tax=Myxococcaceae TaxID=31 RepID=UPI00351A0FE7
MLLVEPRAESLEATRVVLMDAGFRVVPLSRYEAAVPLFQVLRPDAVVLAAQGPDYSALGVARRIRQLSHGCVPLLYLVDASDPEARRFCTERGQCVDLAPRGYAGYDGGELPLKLYAQLRLRESVQRATRSEDAHTTLHDPLTGAFTRPFLLALIGQEVRRAERFGGTFSLVAACVDGMGPFRKTYGRGVAERLLVYAAVVLGQTVREADVVARVDEEAFALFLPGTPQESVAELTGRVHARFEQARFQVEGKVVRTDVSLGSVSFPDTVGSPGQLLTAALADLRRGREARRTASGPRLSI